MHGIAQGWRSTRKSNGKCGERHKRGNEVGNDLFTNKDKFLC